MGTATAFHDHRGAWLCVAFEKTGQARTVQPPAQQTLAMFGVAVQFEDVFCQVDGIEINLTHGWAPFPCRSNVFGSGTMMPKKRRSPSHHKTRRSERTLYQRPYRLIDTSPFAIRDRCDSTRLIE